jgi:hypothetical protein
MNDSLKPQTDDQLVRSLLLPVAILVVTIMLWFIVTSDRTPVPPVPQPPTVNIKRNELIYDAKLKPLVDENYRANLAAVERFITRINDSFNKYRKGIEPFGNDITSMGTRFSILKRMPADWWYKNNSVQDFVQKKFETHIFSEKQLNEDLTSALTALNEEFQANGYQLLAEAKLAIYNSDLTNPEIPDYKSYDEDVKRLLLEFSTKSAKDSVYNLIATNITSEVAGVVVKQIIAKVLIKIGTTATVSATAGGGTAAASATAGAGTGTLGGPLGTAFGFGVGLVVGIMVDQWMTDNFKATLQSDLNNYLTSLHDGLIEGVNNEPGFGTSLNSFCLNYKSAQEETIRRILQGASK